MLKSETYTQTLLKGLQDLKDRNVGCDLTLSSKVRGTDKLISNIN